MTPYEEGRRAYSEGGAKWFHPWLTDEDGREFERGWDDAAKEAQHAG